MEIVLIMVVVILICSGVIGSLKFFIGLVIATAIFLIGLYSL